MDSSLANTPGQRNQRPKRRGKRRRTPDPQTTVVQPTTCGVIGGCFAPLSHADQLKIDSAARDILSNIGFSEAPDTVVNYVTTAGGRLSDEGRLTFPDTLTDSALAGFNRDFTLHGQHQHHDLLFSGQHVYTGSGGAAPFIIDLETGAYRDATLRDLYDAARLVDNLENIHFFSRSLVARDMTTSSLLDINTAYASLSGTAKHVFTSCSEAQNVNQLAEMCYLIAGSKEAFINRPFLSLNINHVVPPLRFDAESCEVMAEAARLGIPIHANTFGQLGASSQVTMAGCIAQSVAETLAGMIFAWLVNPAAKITFGARPMLTDLRTGAMTGGSGEQALLMAATIQMAHYYDLPNTCIAGATDSKVPDAQSGYEKSLSVTLAAQAGANAITQASGMQASLMACALESYVIDNDMLGGILRAINPIEVNDTTLGIDIIDQVVHGDGHFLGQTATLERMQSDFLYPKIADRHTPQEWQDIGAKDSWQIAKETTQDILSTHYPKHISHQMDQALRAQFAIKLPENARE